MSAASLIHKFGEVIQVKRAASNGGYVDGIWVPGASKTLTMEAYLGESEGVDTTVDSAGNRTKHNVTVYTVAELFPQLDDRPADEITASGRHYQVMAVKTYKGKISISQAVEIDD